MSKASSAGKGDSNTRIDPVKYREARYWRILAYKKEQEKIAKSNKCDKKDHAKPT